MNNKLPLAASTVISREQSVAAPFATRQLADLGARVIKIERASGDFARGYDTKASGMASYFVWLNRAGRRPAGTGMGGTDLDMASDPPAHGRSGRPPVRQQLSDKAAGYVRGLIMSGELQPGAGVRPENVGEALGISATPAREALQALRVEGFLVVVPRVGFVVAPLTGQDIRDLFRAQALIAGELAARAAHRASAGDLAELEALHHELIAAAARANQTLLEEKNHAFHRQLNLMAETPKMAWVLGLLARYVPRRFYAEIPGWPQATVDDHGRILEGIQARDPELARAAMHDHITHAGELLAANFDQRVASATGHQGESKQ